MSIFINNQIKEDTKQYWFGLMVPILIGWGFSIISISILMSHDGPVSELTYVHYFFLTLWILGTLAIWPLTTWWVIQRATKLENKHRIKGAYLSLKLYVVFLMLYIIPGIVFGLLEGGQ